MDSVIKVTQEAPSYVTIGAGILIMAGMLFGVIRNRKQIGCIAPFFIGFLLLSVVMVLKGPVHQTTPETTIVLKPDRIQIQTRTREPDEVIQGDISEMWVDRLVLDSNAKVILIPRLGTPYSFLASKKQIPNLCAEIAKRLRLSENPLGSQHWYRAVGKQ